MKETPHHTIQDLSTITGMSPRTIHYYIAQGLIRGAGKKGPGTRYSQKVLDRLLLTQRLKAEARMTLREIRGVLDHASAQLIEEVAAGREGLDALSDRVVTATSFEARPAADLRADAFEVPATGGTGGRESTLPQVVQLVAGLQKVLGTKKVASAGSGDRWVTIPITQDIVISARRLRGEEVQSLQDAADYLRRLLVK